MPEIMDFMFKLDVAVSGGFGNFVSKSQQQLGALQQKMQGLQKITANISAFKAQQEAVNSSAARLQTLRQQLDNARNASTAARLTTSQLNIQYAQAQAKLSALSSQYPKNSSVVKAAQKEVQRLGQEYKKSEALSAKFSEQEKSLTEQVKKADDALSSSCDKLHDIQNALREAGVNTYNLTAEQKKLTDAVTRAQKAQDRYNEVRSKLSWGTFKADIMKGMAVIKTFEQPVRVNMDFEQAMAQVRAVLNPTQEEFVLLEKQAKDLGASTQYSATQAANSQENLARAGFATNKILGMMPQVLSVAAADGMELAQAADIIGASLRGFSLDETNSQRIADILAYVSSHSATNVLMAGTALQSVAGTAKTQNISPEKTAAYIATMANYGGLQGVEAATTIERSISALAVRKGDTDKVLNQYGIATIHKQTGRMRTLESVVLELYEKTASKGAAEQQAAFMRVFGKAYGGNMLKFVQGVKNGEFSALEKGITNDRNNAAADMAAMRNNTLKGDVTSLSSAWEGLMIRIGESLTPINRFFTQTLTTAIQTLTKFMNEHKAFFDAAIEAAYLWGAFKISGTVISYFKLGLEYFSAWKALKTAEHAAGLLTAANNAGTLAANMGGAAKSAGLFGVSLNSALGIIGLIVSASILVYQHWEDITAAAAKAGETFKQVNQEAIARQNSGVSAPVGSADYHYDAMMSPYWSQGLPPKKKNALGGIYHSPIWTWAAEAGPEAIIPLSNKGRGIPLLMRAAEMLGITQKVPQSAPAPMPSVRTSRPALYDYAVNAAEQNTSIYNVDAKDFISQGTSSYTNISGIPTRLPNLAHEMGGNISSPITPIQELGSNIRNYSSQSEAHTSSINFPAVNLSVNISGQEGQSDNDLASLIARKVQEVINDIISTRERVAFA